MSKIYYNNCDILVRESNPMDVDSLKDRLKEADIQEVWASHHLKPEEALRLSLSESALSLTVERFGIPAIMFGVTPDDNWLGDKAIVWLLSSEMDRETKLLVLRNSKKFFGILLELYPYLFNYIDERNISSLMWLRFCGATIEEAKPYGIDQKPFHYFHFER